MNDDRVFLFESILYEEAEMYGLCVLQHLHSVRRGSKLCRSEALEFVPQLHRHDQCDCGHDDNTGGAL